MPKFRGGRETRHLTAINTSELLITFRRFQKEAVTSCVNQLQLQNPIKYGQQIKRKSFCLGFGYSRLQDEAGLHPKELIMSVWKRLLPVCMGN